MTSRQKRTVNSPGNVCPGLQREWKASVALFPLTAYQTFFFLPPSCCRERKRVGKDKRASAERANGLNCKNMCCYARVSIIKPKQLSYGTIQVLSIRNEERGNGRLATSLVALAACFIFQGQSRKEVSPRPSCKSFQCLSVRLSPPVSVSGLIPAGGRFQIGGALLLSSTVTSRSINNGVLSCAAARLCEEHGGLCQIGDWQPALGLLLFFSWIETCFHCCLLSLIWHELKASHTPAMSLSVCEALSKAALSSLTRVKHTHLWLFPPQKTHIVNKLFLRHHFLAKRDCPDEHTVFLASIVFCVVKGVAMQRHRTPSDWRTCTNRMTRVGLQLHLSDASTAGTGRSPGPRGQESSPFCKYLPSPRCGDVLMHDAYLASKGSDKMCFDTFFRL